MRRSASIDAEKQPLSADEIARVSRQPAHDGDTTVKIATDI